DRPERPRARRRRHGPRVLELGDGRATPAPGTQVALSGELGVGVDDDAAGHPQLAAQCPRRRQAGSGGESPVAHRVAQGRLQPRPLAGPGTGLEVEVKIHLALDYDGYLALEVRPIPFYGVRHAGDEQALEGQARPR